MLKVLALALIFLWLSQTAALTHIQNGPSYLAVDGRYAETNILISSSLELVVAQDVDKGAHLVGQPIDFRVDLSRLDLPPTVVSSSRWRWRWDQKDQIFQEGAWVQHTYNKSGSYLVVLQIKDPTQINFFDYDLAQINVVPRTGYQLPQETITAKISRPSGAWQVSFQAQAQVDPSAGVSSYNWDFGDGTTGMGQSVKHTYDKILAPVLPLLRVTDSNGLFNDTSISIDPSGNIQDLGSSFPASTSAKSNRNPSGLVWASLGLLILSALVSGLIYIKKLLR